jgi:ABC-type multidrug transport system ATPase subunit
MVKSQRIGGQERWAACRWPPGADANRLPARRTGALPRLDGAGNPRFPRRLNRQPVDKRHRQELCDRLELSRGDLRRWLREYSTGMKRKLGIIQAYHCS